MNQLIVKKFGCVILLVYVLALLLLNNNTLMLGLTLRSDVLFLL